MSTPSPCRWPELFDIAISIIAQANREQDIVGGWSFGGGTTLMLQIGHRESHDIDLFIGDAQVLPYLNPETQDYELMLNPSSYDTDGVRSLKIAFDGVGEIDFICCHPALSNATLRQDVRGVAVEIETPAEIVAKKVYHRGALLQPRDMLDIGAVARSMGTAYLAQPLSLFPEQVATALALAERYHPALLNPVLAGLNVSAAFEGIRETAQEDTVAVLREALGIQGT